MSTTIGENVKRFRSKLNWSQARLAEAAAIGQSAISEIEAGSRYPRLDAAERIAKALNCTVDDLLKERNQSA